MQVFVCKKNPSSETLKFDYSKLKKQQLFFTY